MLSETTKFFKLAVELEKQFKDELISNNVHFRASLNSLSLISVSSAKPELGVSCKKHSQWTSEVLASYIKTIQDKPDPKRPTPEKMLQAWIIKEARMNDCNLPFDASIKFITSELAIQDSEGRKVVSDIIGYDTRTNQLVIIELKSDRLLTRLITQINDFNKIVNEKFLFFQDLLHIHGFKKLEVAPKRAIVWPFEKTSPLQKIKDLEIVEYTYEKKDGNYCFKDYSLPSQILTKLW